jgi:predicted enzyme related to lactoylglutathione lyase
MFRPVHFEIHADDPARASRFYSKLFGWTFEKWGPVDYWAIKTGTSSPGIDGGLVPRRGPRPESGAAVSAFPCTIEVPDIDGISATIRASGGKEALPKMPIPTIGWLAYFIDTEGNIFGVMQNDPNAK